MGIVDSRILKNSSFLKNQTLSTVKEEKDEDRFNITEDQEFKLRVEEYVPEIKGSQYELSRQHIPKEARVESDNEEEEILLRRVCQLETEKIWLKNEISHQEIVIRELKRNEEQSNIIVSRVKKFLMEKSDWRNDFFESVKVLEYVINFCKLHKFFYIEGTQGKVRIDSQKVLTEVSELLKKIKEGYSSITEMKENFSLEENLNLVSEQSMLEQSEIEGDSQDDFIVDTKSKSFAKDLKLDLGFHKEKFLKNNFTFEVCNSSRNVTEESKKLLTNEKSKISIEITQNPILKEETILNQNINNNIETSKISSTSKDNHKIIYICSIEQDLSSEKKSYKIDNRGKLGEPNEVVVVENKDLSNYNTKNLMYNKLFYKSSERNMPEVIVSNEIESKFEWTYDKYSRSFKSSGGEPSDILDNESGSFSQTTEDKISKKLYDLKRSTLMRIQSNSLYQSLEPSSANQGGTHPKKSSFIVDSITKEFMDQDILTSDKKGPMLFITKKKEVMDNFSFNFTDPFQSGNPNKAKDISTEERDSKLMNNSFVDIAKTTQNSKNNVFKDNSNGFQNSQFTQSYNQRSIYNRKLSDDIQSEQIIESVLMNQDSFELKIESNYFNLRPKTYKSAIIENSKRSILSKSSLEDLDSKKDSYKVNMSLTSNLDLQTTLTYERVNPSVNLEIEKPYLILYQPKSTRNNRIVNQKENYKISNMSHSPNFSRGFHQRKKLKSKLSQRRKVNLGSIDLSKMANRSRLNLSTLRSSKEYSHNSFNHSQLNLSRNFKQKTPKSAFSLYNKYFRDLKKNKTPPKFFKQTSKISAKSKNRYLNNFQKSFPKYSRVPKMKVESGLRKLRKLTTKNSKYPLMYKKKAILDSKRGEEDSFVLHVNKKYSNKESMVQSRLINLSFYK